ncbi:hypothetical protein SSX86_005366 [Deinandra increscens subsp. villosa]|uniref:F-box domain-containing protein n=1 Tax=Deinandra increscens subsp. villosa TaxID=3103831 RepID=A0AAP0DLS9_9ASTR
MTEVNEAPTISVLPEGYISSILSVTSPRDACRAASVSKEFNLAADSDAVWERFLPLDYRQLIAMALSPVVFDSKKQLYRRLSESYILLDRGHLGLKLVKESGRKCFMLGARDLLITWVDDKRYWEWGRVPESRFAEVAKLKKVWWLDIYGKIASVKLSPKTTYGAYLVFIITDDSRGLTGSGTAIVSFSGARNETYDVFLQHAQTHVREPRKDGWMEIELGEFYYDDGDEGDVEMVFQDHADSYSKRGLIVEGIEIRPK